MPVMDKAVSTEDLCAEEASPALGVLRLEAILTTLVENKVEALKQENGKTSSVHSSPKSILQKFKCHSSPAKTTLRIEDERKKESKRREKKEKGHRVVSESRQFKKQVLRQETSSPDSQILQGDENKCTGIVSHCKSPSCMDSSCRSHLCYCNKDRGLVSMHDDYISIKMDGYGDIETDAIIAQEELKRARRKRRRRRKRRLKKRLALNPHLVDSFAHNESFKVLQDDELPPRAKWTIVATACLLLFMCLLLVGITLRMAPIIDEIGFFTAAPCIYPVLSTISLPRDLIIDPSTFFHTEKLQFHLILPATNHAKVTPANKRKFIAHSLSNSVLRFPCLGSLSWTHFIQYSVRRDASGFFGSNSSQTLSPTSAGLNHFIQKYRPESMSSTESVYVTRAKDTSASKLIEKSTDISRNDSVNNTARSSSPMTFLSPPKTNGERSRLSSTSSHSSVSDSSAGNSFNIQGNKKLSRTASLEELYTQRKQLKRRKQELRRKSEQMPRLSDTDLQSRGKKIAKRRSSRQGTSRSSSDVEKGLSNGNYFDRPRLQSEVSILKSSRRVSSKRPSRTASTQIDKEDLGRQKRRKKIINIIVAVYFFLFCISILCVVVTLTHRTTAVICDNKNSTKNLTYYTFSPNPVVLYEDNR